MVRPRRCRYVRRHPGAAHFKPQGIKTKEIDTVEIGLEEFEALRLKEYEGLSQTEAAEKMKVSQPTFHRVYSAAKQKIAAALVEGMALKISGGIYKMPNGDRTGPDGQGPMTGRRMGTCGPRNRPMCRRSGGGLRNRHAGLSKEDERKILEEERAEIDSRLQELQN